MSRNSKCYRWAVLSWEAKYQHAVAFVKLIMEHAALSQVQKYTRRKLILKQLMQKC